MELLVVVCMIVLGASAVHPPSYIHPCSKSDPDLDECAKSKATEAIPYILKGDKTFGLPSLVPLKIPEVNIIPGSNLRLKLTDVTLRGLELLSVEDIKIDLDKRKITVVVAGSPMEVNAQYDVDGRILILPINGHGPANFTFVGGVYRYNFDYDLIEKNGKQYASIVNPNLTYDLKRAYFILENLFNGDQTLSTEMNRFLNENWSDVLKDLGPAISETISTVITAIIKGYFTRIPFDELFLP